MASVPRTGKGDVLRNREAASRLRHLRSELFILEGFGYRDRPTVEEARSMAARNARRVAAQRPTPRISS